MTAVQFVHHYSADGVDYVPGQTADIDPAVAKMLVLAFKAVYTNGPPAPTGPFDPYPQYTRDEEFWELKQLVDQILDGSTGTGGTPTGGFGFIVLDPADPSVALIPTGTPSETNPVPYVDPADPAVLILPLA